MLGMWQAGSGSGSEDEDWSESVASVDTTSCTSHDNSPVPDTSDTSLYKCPNNVWTFNLYTGCPKKNASKIILIWNKSAVLQCNLTLSFQIRIILDAFFLGHPVDNNIGYLIETNILMI